jgi:hypothetical protein
VVGLFEKPSHSTIIGQRITELSYVQFRARTKCMQVFSSERGTLRRVLMLCAFAGSVFWSHASMAEPIRTPTTPPIEIMGEKGDDGRGHH